MSWSCRSALDFSDAYRLDFSLTSDSSPILRLLIHNFFKSTSRPHGLPVSSPLFFFVLLTLHPQTSESSARRPYS